MTPNERAEKIAYAVIESICHIVDRNIYSKDIVEGIAPDIAAEIAQAVKLAREEEREYWVKAGTHSYAEEHNRMLRKEGKAEAYEDAAKIVGHEAVHPQDTCDRCDYARKIRARAKEVTK